MDKPKYNTGIPRKVKDNVIDWHNYSVRWNNFNCTGSDTVKEISNYMLEMQMNEQGAAKNNEKVNQLFVSLEETYQQMSDLVRKMTRITSHMKNLSSLSSHDTEEEFISPEIINNYHNISEKMLAMYKKELKVKKTVIENLGKSRDRSQLMFLATTWSYQPYIEDSITNYIEAMLTEMGQR